MNIAILYMYIILVYQWTFLYSTCTWLVYFLCADVSKDMPVQGNEMYENMIQSYEATL